jgi:signal transduction histidine kinase
VTRVKPLQVFGRLIGTTAFRLSLATMVASAIFAGGLLLYVGWNARRLIDEQIGQTLSAQINGLADQYRIGGLRRLTAVIERRSRQPGSFLFLLQGPQGETLAGNISGVPAQMLASSETFETTYQRQDEVDGQIQTSTRAALARVFVLPGNNRLLVGRDLEERERLNEVLSQAIWLLIGAIILFGGLGGFLVARRAIARMDALTATSRAIMAGDLSGRLPLSGSGDEIDRLASNLNAMLVRIDGLMQGMKEVSDNIAHDLRTPLTRLRNSAEEALRKAVTVEEYRAALDRTIEESDGLIRVFNALLLIARSEAGSGTEAFRSIDLSALLADVAEIYEPSAEEAGGSLNTAIEPGLQVRGSRELLGQAVANLLDNAMKYGLPPQPGAPAEIVLAAALENGLVTIAVKDRGAGIPPDQRARAIERFGRLDASRHKAGSGLGLSLVAAVARLHGGTLTLADNAPGLATRLELPAQP